MGINSYFPPIFCVKFLFFSYFFTLEIPIFLTQDPAWHPGNDTFLWLPFAITQFLANLAPQLWQRFRLVPRWRRSTCVKTACASHCTARCLTVQSWNQLNGTRLLWYGDGIEIRELFTCEKNICFKISYLSLQERPTKRIPVKIEQSDSDTSLEKLRFIVG